MNIQEQEQWDYEAGCQSELKNAYDYSRMNTDLSGDSDKIRRFVQEEKYVVVENVPVYCNSTDAYIGSYQSLVEVCFTREEAESILNKFPKNCDIDVFILPRKEVEQFNQVNNTDFDDIPF